MRRLLIHYDRPGSPYVLEVDGREVATFYTLADVWPTWVSLCPWLERKT